MDTLSILLFFIYAMVILILLVYVSPILAAVVMIIIPILIAYLFPEPVTQFLSMEQFSLMNVQIYNIHMLLMLWSALLGIIIYSELLSWYLLIDEQGSGEKKEISLSREPEAEEPPKSAKNKIMDFLLKLGKIMSGGK